MKKRFLWLSLGSLGLVLLAGIVVALREPKPIASGPLTLPDGSVVSIVAVTYGTNHVVGPPLARLVARMPAALQPRLQGLLGRWAAVQHSTTTSEASLVVWLARATNNANAPTFSGYFSAFLSDASGFISGDEAVVYIWLINPSRLQFRLVPRRDRIISLNFFYHNTNGVVTRCGSLPFANPLYGKFPQWKPEPLPATRRVGDVAVTLEKLSTGHDYTTTFKSIQGGGKVIEFGTNCVDGRSRTVGAIRLQSLSNTNEVWCVADVEVSDATGNSATNTSIGWGNYQDGYFTFEPGLWPGEAAWKLRCGIKRVQGFAPGETFAFRDVPLGRLDETNRLGWVTTVGGVTVILDQVLHRAPNTNSSWSSSELSQVQLTAVGLSNGVHLDLISARTDDGTKLESSSCESSGDWRSYGFRNIPTEARTADFIFAVQRSRWVEFTVKPEVGPLRVEYNPQRQK